MKLAMRRQLTTGKNFDLVTGVDLNNASEQYYVRQYFLTNDVLVAVMATTCAPFGPLGTLNRKIHPEAGHRTYDNAAPHGRFCGEIALLQLQKDRHFMSENPHPTTLYHEFPWSEVCKSPDVKYLLWDRCQTGLRQSSTGLPIRKRSGWLTSHVLLVAPFTGYSCTGKQVCAQHGDLQGQTHELQVWT